MDIVHSNSKLSQWSIVILAVALFLGLVIHGCYMSKRGSGENAITVTGSVKERVVADLAKWNANISRPADLSNLQAVMTQVKNDGEKIKKFVVGLGIPETAITFQPLQTDKVYEQVPGTYVQGQQVIGYTVRQDIRVESAEIEKIEAVARDASQLSKQDIVFNYQMTEYHYTKLSDMRPALFAAATKDAQVRADAVASGTGSQVGNLRSAKTGVIQVLPPNSTEVSDYGAYDLTTKEKDVFATVNVSFELK